MPANIEIFSFGTRRRRDSPLWCRLNLMQDHDSNKRNTSPRVLDRPSPGEAASRPSPLSAPMPVLRQPESGYPAAPTTPCYAPPTLPSPLPRAAARTVGSRKDPKKLNARKQRNFLRRRFWVHSARSCTILGIWFSKSSTLSKRSKYPETPSLTRMQGNTVYLTIAARYCKTITAVLRVLIRILCRSSDSDLTRTGWNSG